MKKLENYKKKIINEINNSDLDLTAIYRIVTSEELLSYARGLRLSKDTTEIMGNVNKLVDEVEIYYQELIATAKKLDKAMYVCLIVNAILLFISSPSALIVLFAGLNFARQAHVLRQEFVDNTFRAEIKKKSNDLANTSYNIVNFIKKAMMNFEKLSELEQNKIIKQDVELYLTEEEKKLYINNNTEKLEESNLSDTIEQEVFEVPVQETGMKLERIPKTQKNNKKHK